jgi:hypothetical protein
MKNAATKPMTRNQILTAYLVGKKKTYVAAHDLGLTDPRDLSTLLRNDIDDLIRRIDDLPVTKGRK